MKQNKADYCANQSHLYQSINEMSIQLFDLKHYVELLMYIRFKLDHIPKSNKLRSIRGSVIFWKILEQPRRSFLQFSAVCI